MTMKISRHDPKQLLDLFTPDKTVSFSEYSFEKKM